MDNKTVTMAHGAGGRQTSELIDEVFKAHFANPDLTADDAAVLVPPVGKMAVSTDGFIVSPAFFPGGNIGKLSICGTVNDLACMGAKPMYLTCAFVIEEGFPMEKLEEIAAAMEKTAKEAGVRIVSGDTKVAGKGQVDGVFITTTGMGEIQDGVKVGGELAKPGDAIIVTGDVGRHGCTILLAREDFGIDADVTSDCAPLWGTVKEVMDATHNLHVIRDATRGGVGTVLYEIAGQSNVGIRLDAAKEYETGSIDSNIEILSWFNNMVKEKKSDAYIVAEVWSDLETYAQYYQSGIDSSFDFTFADKDGVIAKAVKGTSGASSYGKAIVRLQDALGTYSDSYIDAPFYTNHDMGRGAGYYSGDTMEAQTKLAQAMNLLMSGSSFLYYGEELGMKGAGKDENKRAPMYWSKDAGAEGMCLGPQDMDVITMIYDSLAEQQDDGNSIYWYVKEALRLRNAYPEISHGTAEFLENLSDDAVCVLRKNWQDSSVIVVFNCTKDERTVDLSQISADSESGDLKLAGELLTGTRAASWQDGTLTLPAYGVAILK